MSLIHFDYSNALIPQYGITQEGLARLEDRLRDATTTELLTAATEQDKVAEDTTVAAEVKALKQTFEGLANKAESEQNSAKMFARQIFVQRLTTKRLVLAALSHSLLCFLAKT